MSCRHNHTIKKFLYTFLTIAIVLIAALPSFAAPDADVTDIYTPSSLVALQTFVVTVELFNYGTDGTVPINMYIDGAYQTTFYISVYEWSYSLVDITVTGGLTAGYHTLMFCASNCRTEGWTWTGTSDLHLTDIYPPSSLTSGTDTIITARIDNTGNADAGPFEVDMYLDGQYFATWTYSSGLPAQYYSEPSITITGGLVDGSHSIEFVADVLGQVAESNESNNNRTESFTWSGGVPDLELTDIYQPSSLTSGTDTTITAKLTNIGYADAGPFEVDLYIDGNWVATWTYSSGLQAQYYSEPSITLTGGLVDGSHDIEFYSDVLYQVSESDETNNNRIETFAWSGGVPDLELTDIYDPTSLVSGEDSTITAKVTNIGYADANQFYLDIYVDGEFVGYFDYTTGLPAWTYSEASVTFLGGLPSGDHDIQFIADSLDEVAESDETNNVRTETWTWTGQICTSSTGSGIGVLGDNKNHIDTCYVSSSDTYDLYDIARRANNNPHGHNGQMLPNAAIETHYYGTGLMNDPDNVWNAGNQASGVDAHVYAARVYDYLRYAFALNSFDTNGSSMKSIVENTSAPNNAYWDGMQINIGVGSGQLPYSGALDVVAHEWGHAVTDNVSIIRQVETCQSGDTTAGLCYEFESGALDEAFSDWMGTAVEHAYGESNWTMGEGINIIRDLSNPPAFPGGCDGISYPTPDHMTGYINCTNTYAGDWGGVHTNSGIPNKMFYLLSEGGTHPVSNIAVQGIGIIKAIQIAYKANMEKWANNATFQDALDGMVWAAEQLYGQNSNEVYQVKNAWAAVGVGTIPVIIANTSPGGTVSGGGSAEWGASMTVTASPDSSYTFVNWTENDVEVSTSASYTFTADGDRTLLANFAAAQGLSINPVSYYFGSFYVGNPSSYKTFTLTNNGLTALTIQSVSITGTNFQEFSYIDICTVDILSPSGDCIIDVRFHPLSAGAKNASLTIQSDDPVNPLINVPLSGTGMNNTPVADAGGPYTGMEGQSITLDGSGSNDADGTIDLYEWDIDDDGTYDYNSAEPTQGHTYTQDGTYTIKLRVTDNNGAIDEATTTADISDTVPTADFTGSPAAGEAPLTVDFTNNSGGYDTPLTYAWDCDNNGTVDSTAINAACIYNNAGLYTVKLTATDSDGSADTLIRTDYITVEAVVYHYIQEAYDAAVDTNALQIQSGRFTEDLNIDQDKSITLRLGYDCDYLTNTGTTRVRGDVVISNGVIIIDSGVLRIE